eukprot:TRINITY_DN4009_c1_g1_i1.p1 TRINITY_DN4009_c1_g1~~TRINITY_DN4009_c1_g1_i1.p1  ORF type:complete len:534 (+),score=108.03 TRINITY_DN4009_c1_g1_i1:246-1847(+)
MSGYTEEGLIDKLSKLNVSQQSIQTLSRWIMYHRKRVQDSVQIWEQELYKAARDRKIIFLYLANDIMQNSRKKGGEFIKYFSRCIPSSILHVSQDCTPEDKRAIERLLDIWAERRVYPKDYVESIKNQMNGGTPPTTHHKTTAFPISDPSLTPPELHSSPSTPSHATAYNPTEFQAANFSPTSFTSNSVADNLLSNSVIFKPLVSCLKEVESAEMSVGIVSEKATDIRQEITSLLLGSTLNGISTQHELTLVANDVEDAMKSLNEYVSSLRKEEQARVKLITELKQCIAIQEEGIEEAKRLIANCEKKLQNSDSLKHNMQELFSTLPSISSPQKRPSSMEKELEPPKRSKLANSPSISSSLTSPLLTSNSPNIEKNSHPIHSPNLDKNIAKSPVIAHDPRLSHAQNATSPSLSSQSVPQVYQPNKVDPWLERNSTPQNDHNAKLPSSYNNYQQPSPHTFQPNSNLNEFPPPYTSMPHNYQTPQQNFSNIPNNNYQPGTPYTFPHMWPQQNITNIPQYPQPQTHHNNFNNQPTR